MTMFQGLRSKYLGVMTNSFPGGEKKERGMTLIEIMIVIALLGTLGVVLLNTFGGTQEQANKDQTLMLMRGPVAGGLDMFKIHNGKYPKSIQDLVKDPGNVKKWAGPYVQKSQLFDMWGEEIQYELKGRQYQLTSAGPDGQFGTADDIHHPEKAAATN